MNKTNKVKLKSKVLTVTLHQRTKSERGYTYNPVPFNDLNNYINSVDENWWESVKNEPFDRTKGMKYSDAFKPI